MAGAISNLAQFAFFFGAATRTAVANPVAMIAMLIIGPIAAMISRWRYRQRSSRGRRGGISGKRWRWPAHCRTGNGARRIR